MKAVGGRLLAVGGCDGVWECLWGMVRAGALGGGGASSDSLVVGARKRLEAWHGDDTCCPSLFPGSAPAAD